LSPFHWRLEFPDVFYQADGNQLPPQASGFDAVLGNPPYVSTHTSKEEAWRGLLERRAGYLEDLYVHFTDLGFALLRPGGNFGFIVSDTFFTLATKLRMRQLLQSNHLVALGQCDPFKATVDAAIFVARKGSMEDDDRFLFIQARRHDGGHPQKELPRLPAARDLAFSGSTPDLNVNHGVQGCLRLHEAPVGIYRTALKQAFFEPTPAVLGLYRRFNEALKDLTEAWWDRIATSQKFADNLPDIRAYHATLRPGDITLVGLIAEGGQGMRTANNGRFLGYLTGTPQAAKIEADRERWTQNWLRDPDVGPAFRERVAENGGDPNRPTTDILAWEASVDALREAFDLRRLEFTKSDLYRVVPAELLATPEDFDFTRQRRKAELLARWQAEPLLAKFWDQVEIRTASTSARALRVATEVTDEVFCRLCQELQTWVREVNAREGKSRRIPRGTLGLRSSEDYSDAADAARVATIYNGLYGQRRWVPFRKGDPEGNRWADNEPLFVDWSAQSVDALSSAPESRWQGHRFFFTPGVTWTAVANHVAVKARYQDPCVFDADSMRLTPNREVLDPLAFLAWLNSDVVSFFKMKFLKHTQKWEIGDLRMLPLVMPARSQEKRLAGLAERAIFAKRLNFAGQLPPDELVGYVRGLEEQLRQAPSYLRPKV